MHRLLVIRKAIYLLIFGIQTCLANPSSLASQRAYYDGSILCLEGKVAISHSLGSLTAVKAKVEKDPQEKSSFFISKLTLHQLVHMKLPSSTEVACDDAVFDFSSLKATLTSACHVQYKTLFKHKDRSIPLELLTPHLDITILEDKTALTPYQIGAITALQGVKLIYDNASYFETSQLTFAEQKIFSSSGGCTWNYAGHALQAQHFICDLVEKKIQLQDINGHLEISPEKNLMLHSELFVYHQEKDIFCLEGHPEIELPHLGKMYTSGQIQLQLHEQKPVSLRTDGLTTITKGPHEKLTSHGPIFVDQLFQVVRVEPDPLGYLLTYDSETLALQAEAATLTYEDKSHLFSPHQVTLEGKVKIISKEMKTSIEAVAEEAIYHVATKNCILKGSKNEKVLVRQKKGAQMMSADEIHMIYDPFTKEYSLSAVGRLKLSFTADEKKIFNKVFHDKRTPS